MQKKIVFIILFSFLKITTQAQVNLVPDGSFEDTTVGWQLTFCEGSLNQWHTIDNYFWTNWWRLMSTKRINDTFTLKLPNNQFLSQYPKHGNNTIGLVVLNKEPLPHTNLIERSVIRSKLSSKLIVGKQYCATIYVNAQDFDNNYWTNGLGMYFDNGQLDTMVTIHHDSSGYYPGVIPQVQCNFLINDTANWMKVQGSFTANGTEEYITINNFQSDSNTWQVYNGYNTFSNGQVISIDNASLIPIDIQNWLYPTYYNLIQDSVWVGLDKFDYSDGEWFTNSMQYITTGPGFWVYPPYEVGKKWIHEINVCGVLKYDTTEMVEAPLSSEEYLVISGELKVFPNPANESVTISITKLLHKNEPIEIVDATGKVVYSLIPKENIINVDVRSLVSGIYVVRYGGGNVKLVVE